MSKNYGILYADCLVKIIESHQVMHKYDEALAVDAKIIHLMKGRFDDMEEADPSVVVHITDKPYFGYYRAWLETYIENGVRANEGMGLQYFLPIKHFEQISQEEYEDILEWTPKINPLNLIKDYYE